MKTNNIIIEAKTNYNSLIKSGVFQRFSVYELPHVFSLLINNVVKKLENGEDIVSIKLIVESVDHGS